MRGFMMALATVGGLLLLSGCASAPAPSPQGVGYAPSNPVVYGCRTCEQLEVRYFPNQGVAVLVRNGRTQELQQQPAGSGIFYSGAGVNLQGKGRELRIDEQGKPPLECLAADVLTVAGQATYRERALLPAGAVLEVSLQDTARADAPARVVATTQKPMATSPTAYELKVVRDRLQPNARYTLRARVLLGDRLLYTSDTAIPVALDQPTFKADIPLRRVADATGNPGAPQAY